MIYNVSLDTTFTIEAESLGEAVEDAQEQLVNELDSDALEWNVEPAHVD